MITKETTVDTDTIVAIATPLGRGGIGILRLSGPLSMAISQRLIRGSLPRPRTASCRDFIDAKGEVVDQGIILCFHGPNSFTGEDIVEFQGHSSPPVLNTLLRAALEQGARLARPGEFSERAFLNNRLDLIQAESIADLIHASSEKAARAAMCSLQGVFSKQIDALNEELVKLRTRVEAAIDFSEEDIDLSCEARLEKEIEAVIETIELIKVEAVQGQRLQEGVQLLIMGPPNAGKSSLLNALSGENIAIVNQVPGTTRDVLKANIELDGLSMHLIDTAGLHETDNMVEKEGIRRALDTIKKIDRILWVVDSYDKDNMLAPKESLAVFHQHDIKVPITMIRNKIDLTHESPGIVYAKPYDQVHLSAVTGRGLTELKIYLKEKVGYNTESIGFSARQRHTYALQQAMESLDEGLSNFQSKRALELLAVHLSDAHRTLGEITGLFTTEDLLGRIFSTFCIGK